MANSVQNQAYSALHTIPSRDNFDASKCKERKIDTDLSETYDLKK